MRDIVRNGGNFGNKKREMKREQIIEILKSRGLESDLAEIITDEILALPLDIPLQGIFIPDMEIEQEEDKSISIDQYIQMNPGIDPHEQ